ncbi:MAG: sigma 54-interacting transcriptional regulator [Desulfobacteraceae bacterium]|jgi:PAS domain S-box-containing protein
MEDNLKYLKPTLKTAFQYTEGIPFNAEKLLRTEDALKRSEQQFRMVLEKMDNGIAIVQEEKIVAVNQALCSMLDAQADDLLHTSLWKALKINDVQKPSHMKDEIRSASGQVIHTTSDGRELWLELFQSRIQWGAHEALMVMLKDITARKVDELAFKTKARQLWNNNPDLENMIDMHHGFGNIVGYSPAMQKVYELIFRAAESTYPVLIYGESGTGKELVARMIWQLSPHNRKNFVPINCSAIPDNLFESEMFGHCKGAFTGATIDKPGCFDRANHGTLFWDEVGELSAVSQAKLLRVLENGEYTPVGGTIVKLSDVRIIAATHRNLMEMVKNEEFREDLFYRLHVIEITVPPLRNRKEDLPHLIEFFLKRFAGGKRCKALSQDILNVLYAHQWPGNVRELHNVLCRYIATGRLSFADSHNGTLNTNHRKMEIQSKSFKEYINDFEKQILKQTLEQHDWNRQKAASKLRMAPRTLRRKISQHKLIPPYQKCL